MKKGKYHLSNKTERVSQTVTKVLHKIHKIELDKLIFEIMNQLKLYVECIVNVSNNCVNVNDVMEGNPIIQNFHCASELTEVTSHQVILDILR